MEREYLDISSFFSILGIIANMTVITILVKRRDLRTSWNMVNLPLNSSEILFSLLNIWGCISIQFQPLEPNSWQCTTQGSLIVMVTTFSTFNLVLIAWERFQVICFGKPMTWRIWFILLASIFTYSFVLALLPLLNPRGFTLALSGNYCHVPYSSDFWVDRLVTLLILLDFNASAFLIAYCYIRIYHHYQLLSHQSTRAKVSASLPHPNLESRDIPKASNVLPTPTSHAGLSVGDSFPSQHNVLNLKHKNIHPQGQDKRERIIFFKSLINLAVFGCLWTPFCILMLYQLVTQQETNKVWYLVATFIGEMSSIMYPMSMILLSPAFMEEIKSWFQCYNDSILLI